MRRSLKALSIAALVLCATAPAPALAGRAPSAAASVPSLIVLPDDGVKPIAEAIGFATRSIDMSMRRLDDGRILKALKVASKRGVKVRILLDGHTQGPGSSREDVEKKVGKAGAFIQWAGPEFKEMLQNSFIVDSSFAYVSTCNFTEEALEGTRAFVVRVMDPRDVSEMERFFEADWNRKRVRPSSISLAWAPDHIRTELFRTINRAQRSLFVYVDAISDDHVIQTISGAARRGVTVRVLTAGDRYAENLPWLTKLMHAGAWVRTMRRPRLRANAIISDGGSGEAILGPVGLTASDLDESRGLAAVVREAKTLMRLRETFLSDYASAVRGDAP